MAVLVYLLAQELFKLQVCTFNVTGLFCSDVCVCFNAVFKNKNKNFSDWSVVQPKQFEQRMMLSS